MLLLFHCPSCQGKLRINGQLGGKKVKCPKCSSAILAPPAGTDPDMVLPSNGKTSPSEPTPFPKRKIPKETPPKPAEEEATEHVRPRRKKKRRRREAETSNTWMWWAGGIGVGLILAIVAMILVANSGHQQAVKYYALSLAIMVPISTVILVISMFVASGLGGGIDFGAAHTAIIKAICLLVAVNLVGMLPFGAVLVFPIWLLGLMYLFNLDLWETRFLIFINWMLNSLAKTFLLAILLTLIVRGKVDVLDADHDFSHTVSPAERAEEAVEELGGDIDYAEDNFNKRVVAGINFSGKPVTDDNLPDLRAFPKLRMLDFSNTQIGDKTLAKLKDLKALYQLHLKGTKATDAGVKELQKSLPQLSVTR